VSQPGYRIQLPGPTIFYHQDN